MNIYLAHPFQMRQDVRDWQNFNQLPLSAKGINLINPFYNIPGRNDILEFDKGKIAYSKLHLSDVVTKDLDTLRQCQVVIAFFYPCFSVGTAMELVYADQLYNLVTVSCIPQRSERLDSHPWIKAHSDHLTHSFTDLEELLNTPGFPIFK